MNALQCWHRPTQSLVFWTLLLSLSGLAPASAAENAADSSAKKPNIVLFFVDDLGWSDVGYRNPKFQTPHIDQLLNEGLEFEQAYIACPTCSPSRGTLLTGKHPARLRLVRHIPGGEEHGFDKLGRATRKLNYWPTDPAQFPSLNWLPLEHTTYAEALKEQNYYNQFIGKWHLGHEPYHPIHQGFDSQFGASNWGHPRSYYPPYFKNARVLADETECYLTDKLTNEAVDFIEQYDKSQPFMLTVWYYSVHGPHVGRRDLVKQFEAQGLSGKQAHYAAMVQAVDQSIGQVRAALTKKKVDRDTIIIFLSDQGGAFDNAPLRGGKMHDTLCEGGARVPLVVLWPGVTQAGAKNNSLVQSTDLFPTLVEIAGGDVTKYANIDGASLLTAIKNNETLSRGKPIYGYRAYEDLYASVRWEDWKLLAYRSGVLKLYNISSDIKEEHDLSTTHQTKRDELLSKLIGWEKTMGIEEYSGVQ